jgi:hypothetical protein
MPKQLEQPETPKKKSKFFKYFLILLFSIIIAKYLVLWLLPPSQMPEIVKVTPVSTTVINQKKPEPKEVTLSIDLAPLQEAIGKEYEVTQKDIHDYIKEQTERQRQNAYYMLTKDDGFLDWVFGWGTGYKMMWKKIKGLSGSDDNEVKMVSEKFQHDVISPNFSTMTTSIQNYAANRTEDFYKSAVVQTSKYLNEKIGELKEQGYEDIKVEPASVPWSRYIVTSGSDGFALLELTGITGVSVIAGKFIGAKVATLIGPKMLALVGTKTAALAGSKIAASFSLIFAPLVDYLVNEGTKEVMYNNTKREFESVIDDILDNTQVDITEQVDQSLIEIKNDVFMEINKQINIKAVK